MPLTIGTIASCYVFGAPTLVASPIVSFMGDVTTSVYLSSTTGTWSVPIINTTYEWLSSTDNSTWFTTNITQLSSSFFGLDNKYLRAVVRGVDINLTPVSATSLSVYTSGMTFKPVVLQLNGDIVIPILKDTFIDSSTNNFTITKNGIPSQGTFSPFSYTLSGSGVAYNPTVHGGSGYFDGSTSTLTTPNFTWSSGDFTIETWVNFNNINNAYGLYSPNNQYIFDTGSGNMTRLQIIGGVLQFYINGALLISYALNPAVSVWYHIAVSRQSNTIRLFVNGVSVGTPATSSLTPSAGIIRIGNTNVSSGTHNAFLNGYLSDFRIINGTALYTSNFVRPTTPLTNVTNTSLLINFTNGSVLDGIGKNDLALTGDAKITNNVKKYGTGALYFDGTGDYLFIPASSNLNILSGDFTIECFINVVQMPPSSSSIISQWRQSVGLGGYVLGILNNGGVTFSFGAYSEVSNLITTTRSLTAGTMSHVAITRSGSNFTVFIDGQNAGTAVYAGTRGDIGIATTLGNYLNGSGNLPASGGSDLNAYVDDLRITKGVARYPSQAFPTAALPNNSSGDANFSNVSLLLQADTIVPVPKDTFIDSSSNNFTVTRNGSVTQGSFSPFPLNGAAYNPSVHGGSGYFNGTNDFLTVPSNNAFSFGTGNFTVECWLYYPAFVNTNGKTFFDTRPLGTNGSFWTAGLSPNGVPGFSTLTTGGVTLAAAQSYPNQWVHFAVTRQAGTVRLFINGVIVSSATGNVDNISSSGFTIGTNAFRSLAPDTYFNGSISNVRIVKGTALYTSNFTPSTSPLTNVANTSLLLSFTNSSVLDITSRNNISINGNAGVSNNVKKFGVGALSFDGTGDYLSVPVSSNLTLGTGDFTVECWYYPLASKQYPVALELGNHTLASGCGFFLQDNSALTPMVYSGAFYIPASIPSIVLNQWNHVVWQRTSGNLKIFVNGVGSGTIAFTNNISLPSQVSVGYSAGSIGSTNEFYCNGYIDDFRITKAARYTGSTFTLPTTAYPVR